MCDEHVDTMHSKEWPQNQSSHQFPQISYVRCISKTNRVSRFFESVLFYGSLIIGGKKKYNERCRGNTSFGDNKSTKFFFLQQGSADRGTSGDGFRDVMKDM